VGINAMMKADLSDVYRDYIACLNRQDWPKLEQFVDDDVCYNGQRIGLSGYRGMLERDFSEIPDLHFNIQLLMSDGDYIASRLAFDCSPRESSLASMSTARESPLPRMSSMNFGAQRSRACGR